MQRRVTSAEGNLSAAAIDLQLCKEFSSSPTAALPVDNYISNCYFWRGFRNEKKELEKPSKKAKIFKVEEDENKDRKSDKKYKNKGQHAINPRN